MKKQERELRIIARGEHSDRSHVITGEANVQRNCNGEIIIELTGNASIKHLLESSWLQGKEEWSQEHYDINLTELDAKCEIGEALCRQGDVLLEKVAEKTYKYIQQQEYDPYEDKIREVRD